MARYVGLDAHSKRCVYVIQDENGKILGDNSVPTTIEGLELMRIRHELPTGTRVALETGTMAFFVARRLSRIGLDPLVVDAHDRVARRYLGRFKVVALELVDCPGDHRFE